MRYIAALLAASPLKAQLAVRSREALRSELSKKGVELLSIRRRGRIILMELEYPHNPLPIAWIIFVLSILGILIVGYVIAKSIGEALPEISKMIALFGPPVAALAGIAFVAYSFIAKG